MKSLIFPFVFLLPSLTWCAEVNWNVFGIHDYDDFIDGEDGWSIYAASPNRSPEAGFAYTEKKRQTRLLAFTGNYSNCGNNVTFWALAAVDTVINYDWMQSATPLLDMGLSDYREGELTLRNDESVYIAMIGRDLGDPDGYYTGWVQIQNNRGEIEIVSSALADAALSVGTGITHGFAGPTPTLPTPEPTSGMLMVVGVAILSLVRRSAGSKL